MISAFVAGGLITIAGYRLVSPAHAGFVEQPENWVLRAALLYALMVVGMLARALHEDIQKGMQQGWSGLFRNAFHSASFATAIVVSPIVFFAVYNATREQPDNMIALLLSFQNGFFWHVIFERAENQPN